MDALLFQLFYGALAVGRGCRMDNQRLDVRNVCQNREDLQAVNKLLCFLLSALDIEGEDRTGTVREILLIQLLILRIERRVVDGLNQRLRLQILQNLLGVLNMALDTQGQGFQTLQKQECIERRKGCAGIAQENRTDVGGECCRLHRQS